MADEHRVLELRGITKRFPGVVANDRVDFDLRRGEVHALLGENGAGKSTLMNVLYGLYRPDEGEILIGRQAVSFHSAKDAIGHGIGMVHQHFMLIPVMTVAENIVLAAEPTTGGVILDYGEARHAGSELARTFGFAIDADARVQDIGVGQQQRVEILKALYRRARHPHPRRAHRRAHAAGGGRAVRDPARLTAEGTTVIFISHKLNEVLEIADRITVLRRGKKVDTVRREGATEEGLARMMVGREVLLRVERTPPTPAEPALEVEDLHARDDRHLSRCGSRSPSRRRDRRHRRRRRQRADRARRALSRAPQARSGRVVIAARDMSGAGATARSRPRRRRTSPRTGTGAASSWISCSPRTSRSTTSTAEPNSRLGWLFPKALVRWARPLLHEVRRSRRRPADRAAASRAATNRRSSSRARSGAT